MSSNSTSNAIFFKYNNITVKVKQIEVGLDTNLIQLLHKKFPGKKFPLDTIFILEKNKQPITDFFPLNNGDIVRVQTRPAISAQKPNALVYCTGFSDEISIDQLKDFFELDESVSEKRFLINDFFQAEKFERGVFIEFKDEFQAYKAIKKSGSRMSDGTVIEVQKPFGNILKEYIDINSKYKVVLVSKIPSNATPADIRIFFCMIEIISVHILDDGTCFLEVEDEFLNDLLDQDNSMFANTKLTVKESDYKTLLTVLRGLNSSEANFDQNFGERNFINPFFNRNTKGEQKIEEEEEPHDRILYSNKDFKCAFMSNMPLNSNDLDIARFFDAAQIQPLLMHRKKDGSQAYLEFSSVAECDRALTLDKTNMGSSIVSIHRVKYDEISKIASENSEFVFDSKNIEAFRINAPVSASAPDSIESGVKRRKKKKKKSRRHSSHSSHSSKHYKRDSPEKNINLDQNLNRNQNLNKNNENIFSKEIALNKNQSNNNSNIKSYSNSTHHQNMPPNIYSYNNNAMKTPYTQHQMNSSNQRNSSNSFNSMNANLHNLNTEIAQNQQNLQYGKYSGAENSDWKYGKSQSNFSAGQKKYDSSRSSVASLNDILSANQNVISYMNNPQTSGYYQQTGGYYSPANPSSSYGQNNGNYPMPHQTQQQMQHQNQQAINNHQMVQSNYGSKF